MQVDALNPELPLFDPLVSYERSDDVHLVVSPPLCLSPRCFLSRLPLSICLPPILKAILSARNPSPHALFHLRIETFLLIDRVSP